MDVLARARSVILLRRGGHFFEGEMITLLRLTKRLSTWLEYGREFGPTPIPASEVLAAVRGRV